MIRIFPLEVYNIEHQLINWADQDNQFVEGKDAQLQKALESKGENPKLANLVKKLKNLFYDKYLLNLKEMKLFIFDLDNRIYDERDYLSILYYLGKECLSAIRIGEAGDEEKTDKGA